MIGISINKNILDGEPCITGTRISVELIKECLHEGITIDEICEDYNLIRPQVNCAIDYLKKMNEI